MPSTAMTDPMTIRRRDDSAWSPRWSARAATGGMRTARRAGLMADTTVTPTPDDQGGDHRPGGEDQRAGGQGDAEPLEQGLEAQGGQHAEAQADQRGHQPEDEGLDQHGAEHLASAGPDDAEQGQLPGPLAHDDGEGVEDGEAADEQRDEGEDQQGGGEEGEGLVDGVGRLVGHRLAGHHLHAGGEGGGDGPLDLGLVGPGLGQHVDGVELAGLAEELLGGGEVEGGQGGPGQVVGRPEGHDARRW